MSAHFGPWAPWRLPTLFWLGSSDAAMHLACGVGVALSVAALLGATNALLQLALWALYMSFVHVGQIFYGYGWEIQLLETGLLARLPVPGRAACRRCRRARAPVVVVWLLRWLVFRIMLGAALIKLRNDPCWRDLTCLDFHFETQPNPGPLAWCCITRRTACTWRACSSTTWPRGWRPGSAFGPRRWRHAAGAVLVFFQATLDRERQPVVSQLADDRAGARVLRRHRLGAPAAPARRRAWLGAWPPRPVRACTSGWPPAGRWSWPC